MTWEPIELQRRAMLALPSGWSVKQISPSPQPNCRNCGASHDGVRCEYCGTVYAPAFLLNYENGSAR